jgi:hypothetical protein
MMLTNIPATDPSLIQAPRTSLIDSSTIYAENGSYPPTAGSYQALSSAGSPAPSPHEHAYSQYQNAHMSPSFSPAITYGQFPPQADYLNRRSSISSFHSKRSHDSPLSKSAECDEEGNQKGRCPNPDCGRVFKDLKAHMLTHQSERPEKCPISNCEYNQKGFSRKYDKNRHTLTHYKGTMVCGFCPGSGSAAEKSFNRADVFKRHLTSVHGVEQAPPNSRKRSPTASTRRLASYCEDATGKCSTCSATFTNAQEFYEHLDDCVLRVVQQEEPSEAHNQRHLASVAGDNNVKDTMERHLLTDDSTVIGDDDLEDDEDNDDDDDDDDDDDNEDPSVAGRSGKGLIKAKKAATGARAVIGSCVSKPGRPGRKGLTYSKGGVPLVGRGRKKKKNYPPSWGMSADKMQMKKRVLCVYDGERRLWKDDMMMYNEFEVRMKLADGKSYVTDLDVETLKRAQAFHGASEAEKGPWAEYEVHGFDHDKLEKLMS